MRQASHPEDRVVITGMGLVTPLGSDPAEVWNNVAAGHSGIGRWNGVWKDRAGAAWVQGMPVALAKPYREDPQRGALFASEASLNALKNAGLYPSLQAHNVDPARVGLAVGSSKGGLVALERALEKMANGIVEAIDPQTLYDFFHHRSNTGIMEETGICGPCVSLVSACSTGAHNIITGASWIWDDQADCVLAGASESSFTPLVFSGFQRMGVLARASEDEDPQTVSRPYDRRRRGFVLGEGAGVVVLERMSHALKRGANIAAELTGWAWGGDAYKPVSFDPSGNSIRRAVFSCARRMDTAVQDVDYINCHGTGTSENDTIETRALRSLLGAGPQRTALSSTKPMTGHLLGAAGSVEFILTLLALRNNFVPATLNLSEPDPGCDLDFTAGEGHAKKIDRAMSLSYGFGGHVAALGIQKI